MSWYVFCSYLNFLLPLDHAVDKMFLRHANEILKYILNLIMFKICDLGFSLSCKSPPFNQKD